MPYVDLYSSTDYASIFYATNTPHANVGGFDPEKPTIVILHPVFLDSTWLDLQMGDIRLNAQFNLITFDMRSAGQSTCRPSGRHDNWVDAADLAFCFQVLILFFLFPCSPVTFVPFATASASSTEPYFSAGRFFRLLRAPFCHIVCLYWLLTRS